MLIFILIVGDGAQIAGFYLHPGIADMEATQNRLRDSFLSFLNAVWKCNKEIKSIILSGPGINMDSSSLNSFISDLL